MAEPLPRPTDPWAIVTDLMAVVRGRSGITRFDGDDLDVLLQTARTMMQGLGIPEAAPEDDDISTTEPVEGTH